MEPTKETYTAFQVRSFVLLCFGIVLTVIVPLAGILFLPNTKSALFFTIGTCAIGLLLVLPACYMRPKESSAPKPRTAKIHLPPLPKKKNRMDVDYADYLVYWFALSSLVSIPLLLAFDILVLDKFLHIHIYSMGYPLLHAISIILASFTVTWILMKQFRDLDQHPDVTWWEVMKDGTVKQVFDTWRIRTKRLVKIERITRVELQREGTDAYCGDYDSYRSTPNPLINLIADFRLWPPRAESVQRFTRAYSILRAHTKRHCGLPDNHEQILEVPSLDRPAGYRDDAGPELALSLERIEPSRTYVPGFPDM